MTIAILYICTGRYTRFFEGFYNSSEKYFLPDAQKTYFVWTDDESLGCGLDNVNIYHKECAGFPADSLFRFETFLQAEEELKKFDYIYFFNANAEIKQKIGNEILPDETGLSMGVWPGKAQARPTMFYPYERNKKSWAYVAPYGKEYIYYMGGLNGGTSEAYLNMVRELAHNIRDDYERGIVAKFHDQSHINAYLRHHPCKKLGQEFCWPEEWTAKGFTPKNIFRNKVVLDPYFDKGRKHSLWSKVQKGTIMLRDAIRWYLKL